MANLLQQTLQTAIAREAAAFELYKSTAQLVEPGAAREMLLDLAAQEQGHRTRLEHVLERGAFERLTLAQQERVVDLKITDYLVTAPLSSEATLQDVLIVAGQREAGSHALYSALAQVSEDDQTRALFEFLATEELKHKQTVERLYDDLFSGEYRLPRPESVSGPDQAKEESEMAKWECLVCGYIYDPNEGDPENGVEPGTAFEDLPDDWLCPECGAGKDMFEKMD